LLPRDRILNYEHFLKIVEVAQRLGFKRFRITGGDPLLRRGVVNFVAQLTRMVGAGNVSITTNGALLRRYAGALKRAGIRRINVGLGTLDARRFRLITRGGNFAHVWAGIEECLRQRLEVRINVVLMRNINDREVEDFARLTIMYPVCVRFMEFMPFGLWKDAAASIIMPAMEAAERVECVGRLEQADDIEPSGPSRYYRLRGAQGVLGFITPVSEPFCQRCNRLRLTSDGKLRSCLLSAEHVDLAAALRTPHPERAIAEAIKKAVMLKPERHQFARQIIMSAVGG
jgi:cyclic pyranopterin phosphate synthase